MIRTAKPSENNILTKIAFASKGYWDYPKAFFDVWAKELTITSDYIKDNDVFVYETDITAVGFYSIVELKEDIEVAGIPTGKGFWLDHMFIVPDPIGKGIGKELFYHLRARCKEREIGELGILADPNSRGFYEKMGCLYRGEYPLTIKDRTTPFLVLKIG